MGDHAGHYFDDLIVKQGVQQPGKPGKLGIFLPVYENFLNCLLFELLPDNDREIICKIISVSYDINNCI